jgi:predicted GIY-YIG superfamily endonuclease
MAVRHVDVAHLDAVLAGVADDLRRRVKPHRLGIQQTATKSVGMKTFEP